MQKEKGEDIIKFKKYILESFDQLIEQLQAEQVIYFDSKVKFSMDVLHPGLEVEALSKSELREFQVKHGIKVGDKVLRWSTEFKKEVVSNYMVLVLSKVIQALEELRASILQRLDFNSLEKLKAFLEDQLEHYHKITNSHDGLLYVDPEYRSRTKRLLKNRFDVIWFLNEQYSIFPMEKRPNDHMVSIDADYPFIGFNMDQWSDFETSYRVNPLLKKCLSKNLEPSNTEEETSIVYDPIFYNSAVQKVFHKILVDLNGFDLEGNARKRRFRPLCDALYLELIKKKYKVLKPLTTLKEFSDFLNREDGYDARIPDNGKIISRGGASNYEDVIIEELMKYPCTKAD